MASFWSFIVFVVSVALLVRSINFIRRAKAKHRAALLADGWGERNQPKRLREDRYTRVFLITYAVFGGLLNMVLNAEIPSPILALLISAVVSLGVASLAWSVHRTYVEITHPIGDLALAMRDNLFYRRAKQLEPKGEHGTAEEVTPDRAGFSVNPVKWLAGGYQPVVISDKAVAVAAEPDVDFSRLRGKILSMLGGTK